MSCRSGESFVAEAADIVIIGGGVIGATIPLNFARRDIRDVMVVEKDFFAKDFIESDATGKSSACIGQPYSTECDGPCSIRKRPLWADLRVSPDIAREPDGFMARTKKNLSDVFLHPAWRAAWCWDKVVSLMQG